MSTIGTGTWYRYLVPYRRLPGIMSQNAEARHASTSWLSMHISCMVAHTGRVGDAMRSARLPTVAMRATEPRRVALSMRPCHMNHICLDRFGSRHLTKHIRADAVPLRALVWLALVVTAQAAAFHPHDRTGVKREHSTVVHKAAAENFAVALAAKAKADDAVEEARAQLQQADKAVKQAGRAVHAASGAAHGEPSSHGLHQHTEQALVWGVTGFDASDSIQRPRFKRELAASIVSARLRHNSSALVIMHDQTVTCPMLRNMSEHLMGMPCKSLPSSAGSTRNARYAINCQVGPARLVTNKLYLIAVDPGVLELNGTAINFFSFHSRNQTKKPTALRNEARIKSAEALGLGTWYRYVAHHFLLPLGIRKALYLDGDTCILGNIDELFSVDDDSPLVVAKREKAPWHDRMMLMSWKRLNVSLAVHLFGFNASQEPLTFNAGVMVLNLKPYCEMDIWGKMKVLAQYHATPGYRIFAALDSTGGSGNNLGDNDAVVVVASRLSHFLGAEWNCRQPGQYNAGKKATSGSGQICRIRHMHETGPRGERLGWLKTQPRYRCANLN